MDRSIWNNFGDSSPFAVCVFCLVSSNFIMLFGSVVMDYYIWYGRIDSTLLLLYLLLYYYECYYIIIIPTTTK